MCKYRLPSAPLRRIFGDRRGGTLTLTAVVFPAIIGFSGLALDGAHWYSQRRETQTMADASAVAGAYAKLEGRNQSEIESVAGMEAERNGYEMVATNSLAVNDVSGTTNGVTAPLIEVVVRRQIPLYFASLIMDGTVSISARAISGVRNLGPQCIIALDETAQRAVEFTGNTTADIGCGVASNSDSDEALYISGSAILTANPAQAFGDIAVEGGGTLNSVLPPLPFSPRVPDPYDGLPAPPRTASCDANITNATDISTVLVDTDLDGFTTLCGDVTLEGTLALPPGTYVIKGGDLDIKANAAVTGTGVTFILTADPASDTGRLSNFGNNATFEVSAPATGPYQGVLFYQDPDTNCAANSPNKFTGGSDMQIDGVIYAPACHVEFTGNTSSLDSCVQIVSRTVTFIGNSAIRNDPTVCQNIGLAGGGTGQQQVVLLE